MAKCDSGYTDWKPGALRDIQGDHGRGDDVFAHDIAEERISDLCDHELLALTSLTMRALEQRDTG
jgi:hypothetical protein